MSNMPAKKKSCFQITSVTQAQGTTRITDDTESLDDPDESRTEDVSSEIFDVCRADRGTCERSSSEETSNNAGEPPGGHPTAAAPVNGGLCYKSTGPGFAPPHRSATSHPSVPGPATHLVTAATNSTSTSCSSRFRVIKLDHGTGEPFRRGRWTCTEFHERDSDSNANRTVDGTKPAVRHDHSVDRDSGLSGLGPTSNSLVTSSAFSAQTLEKATDSGYSGAHPHPSEAPQQGYSPAPQMGGGASAFQPTGPPQNSLSNSLNGVHHGAPATQAQQFAYSPHPAGHSTGQPDYSQQHFVSSAQNLPVSVLPGGTPTSQVPSPLTAPAVPGARGVGSEAASAQGLLPHTGHASAMAPILPGSGPQQHVGQTQPSGGSGTAPATSTATHGPGTPVAAPCTVDTPPGVPSQTPGTGPVVPLGFNGGAASGLPSVFSPKSDGHPVPGAIVFASKDGVKPFIGEGFNLPSPGVNSLFGIHITMDVDEDRNPSTAFYQAFRPNRLRGSKPLNDGASGASVVAIDNKIEQAMDLVKSHLMYAVREEVEVLKEQIKELYERNSMLERENAVLKSLANTDQLGQVSSQLHQGGSTPPSLLQQHPLVAIDNNNGPLAHREVSQSAPHRPNITSA